MLAYSAAIRILGSLGSRTRILIRERWSCPSDSIPIYLQRLPVLFEFRTLATLRRQRIWYSSCPRIWNSWKTDDINWVIRDLRPEDDEEALNILTEYFCRDETLCKINNIINDPISMSRIKEFWRCCLTERLTLGCYEEKDGRSRLVGLNVLIVIVKGQENQHKIDGKAWSNVYAALKLCDDKLDTFKLLEVDRILYGLGIVVHEDYRQARLGRSMFNAREHLARHLGIEGTSAVFTGPASQISAEHAGFSTALTLTLKDLAKAGLDYPKDDDRCVKVMVKKYQR